MGSKVRATSGNAEQQELALKALKQFRVIYGSVRSHFREIEDACGVSGSQLWILHEVRGTPGMGVSQLAERLSIHQTTCSQLVEKLVARRYLVKVRSTEDQRRVGLTLTAAASKLIDKAPGPAEGVLPEALLRLSPTALASLTRELEKVSAQLAHADQKAAGKPLADL